MQIVKYQRVDSSIEILMEKTIEHFLIRIDYY